MYYFPISTKTLSKPRLISIFFLQKRLLSRYMRLLYYWILSTCPVSEMTYHVSSGTLKPSIPYLSTCRVNSEIKWDIMPCGRKLTVHVQTRTNNFGIRTPLLSTLDICTCAVFPRFTTCHHWTLCRKNRIQCLSRSRVTFLVARVRSVSDIIPLSKRQDQI